MLSHLTPRVHPCELCGSYIELIDLQIPELRLDLRGGNGLASRRSYPNKRYVVSRRNVWKK